MTAALMLYAIVTSACVAVAALAAEALLRQLGRPLRWVWAAALGVSVVLAALAPLRRSTVSATPAATATPGALDAIVASRPLDLMLALPRVPQRAADALLLGWFAASGLLVLVLAGVQVRYRALRRRWPVAIVDGAEVRVSPRDGPAVMGLWRPDIVVPRWFFEREPATQQIVVRHEREHVRAGDHRVLAGATLAAVLMPWNPAVWWMLARLRLAVELDCDARVLRAGTLPFVYGNLLIDVAALNASLCADRTLPALALLNPPSNLQRRLLAMHPDRTRFPRIRGGVAAAIALVGLVAACDSRLPTDADVASLDAAKAAAAAKRMGYVGDTIIYIVDGKEVPAAEAEKIKADDIERTEIAKAFMKSGDGPSRITIDTKRAADERGRVALKRDSSLAITADTLHMRSGGIRVVEDGVKTVVRPRHDVLDTFTGLLFVDGVQTTVAHLRELPQLNIESVEVLKGYAAAKAYSDPAAANGVIRIVTKK